MSRRANEYKTFRKFLWFWVALGALVGLVNTVRVVAERRSEPEAVPAAPAPGQGGAVAAPTEDGFQASFPTQPERKVTEADTFGVPMRKVSYQSASPDAIFGVEVGYVPETVDVGNPQSILERVLGRAATRNHAQVAHSEPTTVAGMAARDYEMTMDPGFVKGRLILRDRRVYMVAAVTRTPEVAGYQEFLASFRFV